MATKFDQEPSIVDRMGVARLWPGGRVDRTFGQGGRVQLRFDTNDEAGLVIDGDDLLIGTLIDGGITLVRLSADGALVHRRDAYTFGADWGLDVVADGAGGHLVVGYDYRSRNDRVAVVRYDAEDEVDRSFGLEGVALVEVTPGHDRGTGIVVDDEGRYVVAVNLGRKLGVIRLEGG
jgi:hypothetical protein